MIPPELHGNLLVAPVVTRQFAVALPDATMHLCAALYDKQHGHPVLYEAAVEQAGGIVAVLTPRPVTTDKPCVSVSHFWSTGHTTFRATIIQPRLAELLSLAQDALRRDAAQLAADAQPDQYLAAFANAHWYTCDLLGSDRLAYIPGEELPQTYMQVPQTETALHRAA